MIDGRSLASAAAAEVGKLVLALVGLALVFGGIAFCAGAVLF